MATLNLQVGASTDDARNINGALSKQTNPTTMHLGKFNTTDKYWNGFRFTGVTIPQGATITSATLDLYSAAVTGGTLAKTIWYGALETNGVTFNTTTVYPEGKPRTTATVTKDFTTSAWTTTGFGIDPVTVTTLVQEIVNQGGWSSGNALILLGYDNGSANTSYIGHNTYDSNTTRAAKLQIVYSSATAVPGVATGLTAVADNEYRTVLNWTDNGTAAPNNEDTYRIERSTTSGSGFSEIGSVGTDVTHYIDLTGSASTTYYYRVRARNTFGDSSYTSEASVTTKATNSPWTSEIEAWFFPTAAHSPVTEYTDGRTIKVLKPEYLHLNSLGAIEVRDTTFGTYGYSSGNATSVKAYSAKQFITISCGVYADLQTMLNNSTNRNQAVTDIVSYITTWGFTGADIDFEKFSSWGATEFTNFNTFLASLKSSLNSAGMKLAVNVPAIRNSTYQTNYSNFTYEGLIANVDYMCIMAYDYHFDNGAGQPISPNAYVTDIIDWTVGKIGWTNLDKIVMGIPSYSYHGTTAGFTITEETYAESTGYTGFGTATRDTNSYEMMWANGGTSYVYQDSSGLDSKRKLVEDKGIKHVSVWHLGGNNWFSGTRAEAGQALTKSNSDTATTSDANAKTVGSPKADTATTSEVIVKSPVKKPTDNDMASDATVRSPVKKPADSVTTSDAVVKAYVKNLADGVTTSDTSTRTTTFIRTLSDSTTSTDAKVNKPAPGKADSVTSSDARTASVVLYKSDTASTSDNLSAGGSVPYTKSLSDSVTSTDAISNKPVKSNSDTATTAEAIVKSPVKKPTDFDMASDFPFKKPVKIFADSITLIEAKVNKPVKKLADTDTTADAKVISYIKNNADSLTTSDVMSKNVIFIRALADSISDTDAIAKTNTLYKADNVSLTDAQTKAFTKKQAETQAIVDLILAVIVRTLTLSDGMTISESSKRQPVKRPAETLALSEAYLRTLRLTLMDSLLTADAHDAVNGIFFPVDDFGIGIFDRVDSDGVPNTWVAI